jgi:hypothetical protein
MSWASRRQFKYFGVLVLILGFIAFLFIYPSLNKVPTCSDGSKNGDETGVDCGGSCQRVCNGAISEPVILWSRAFPVTGNIFNLVAFVENHNKSAGVQNASYEFRIYDTNNLLIGRRVGSTFIPPNQQFAVFESRFDGGQSQIKSVVFSFVGDFVWIKREPTIETLPIKVDNIILGDDKNSPTLSARVNNDSIYDLPSFDVIAILYNADHNAINASKTRKEGLASNANSLLSFSWPQPFLENPVTKDILVQINPFTVSF